MAKASCTKSTIRQCGIGSSDSIRTFCQDQIEAISPGKRSIQKRGCRGITPSSASILAVPAVRQVISISFRRGRRLIITTRLNGPAIADYIDKYGWCQHVETMPDGRVCTLGEVLYPSEPVSTVMSVVQWAVICNKQSECEALLHKYLGIGGRVFGIAKWMTDGGAPKAKCSEHCVVQAGLYRHKPPYEHQDKTAVSWSGV